MKRFEEDDDLIDFTDDSFTSEPLNPYLADSRMAAALIGKIITADSSKNNAAVELINTVKSCFTKSFSLTRLKDEARRQIELEQLADKLFTQKIFGSISDKAVVGVGGKFSAGKSSFINSVLGIDKKLLPEDQNPTTSIATYIMYGSSQAVSAYTSDNLEVALDTEAMQALTHNFNAEYNIGFSYFIKRIIISEPEMKYENIAFMDTPGYSKADGASESRERNSLTDENRALEQLQSVDYLIWLIDIENGVISQTDIDFIQKLNFHDPILIVLNKSDKKPVDDVRKIIDKVRETVQNAGINVFAVTAYSSFKNEEFENTGFIQQFLDSATAQNSTLEDTKQKLYTLISEITAELSSNIEAKQALKQKFEDVIINTYDVTKISSLVELYGQTLEELRNIGMARKALTEHSKLIFESL